MSARNWQPETTLRARSQRLAERAYREVELARRAPDRESVIAHCERAAVLLEELADLIRRYGPNAPPSDATPAR